MIVNYTGRTIIINTSELRADHSNIFNYTPNKKSVILKDAQSANLKVGKNTNIYIITKDCMYLGHFPMNMMQALPDDPIMYVGLRKNNEVWMSRDALPADVDFGLSRVVDQSQFWIIMLNPYFYLLFVFLVFIIYTVIIVIAYRSINNLSLRQTT